MDAVPGRAGLRARGACGAEPGVVGGSAPRRGGLNFKGELRRGLPGEDIAEWLQQEARAACGSSVRWDSLGTGQGLGRAAGPGTGQAWGCSGPIPSAVLSGRRESPHCLLREGQGGVLAGVWAMGSVRGQRSPCRPPRHRGPKRNLCPDVGSAPGSCCRGGMLAPCRGSPPPPRRP